MKIIIFFILFIVQAQDIDDELIINENSSITQIINENDRTSFLNTNEMNFSTISESQTWSYSTINDLDLTTSSDETNIIVEEQWSNVNQSYRRDSYRSFLFWKRTDGNQIGANYILTSEPRCIRQMCSVKLKYNGTFSSRISGCLSFSLRTRGQPVGQLWIIEDQQQENTSQKIQLINKTLRVEHSLRSKIKNLSIETKILFRNPQKDALLLSNLNVNWKGACPKRRVPTPSPRRTDRRATLEDDFMTLSSDSSGLMNTLTTNEEFETSQQDLIYDSTTETNPKRSFSFVNQKNVGWSLTLISLFCFLIILSAIGHSLWLIRRHHQFTWHVTFNSQIQFLARRSIRSSTRSETKIATISQISYDILNSDLQKEQTDNSITNSDRSTPMSYYTYL